VGIVRFPAARETDRATWTFSLYGVLLDQLMEKDFRKQGGRQGPDVKKATSSTAGPVAEQSGCVRLQQEANRQGRLIALFLNRVGGTCKTVY
jgi:hypothetical protein